MSERCRSSSSRIVRIVALLASSASLFACQAPPDVAAPASSTRVERVRQLQQKLITAEPSLPVGELKELQSLARSMVALQVAGEGYPSAAVYFCEKATDDGQCASVFADDTAHTLESEHTTIALQRDAPPVVMVKGFEIESFDAFWQIPRGKPNRLPSEKLTLDLRSVPTGDEVLLIALLRGVGNPLVQKHVWVFTLK